MEDAAQVLSVGGNELLRDRVPEEIDQAEGQTLCEQTSSDYQGYCVALRRQICCWAELELLAIQNSMVLAGLFKQSDSMIPCTL
jgi:hypothetical protein